MGAPRASIVIPVWNEVDTTLRCLQALSVNTADELYEVVVVDNASTDATPALLAELEGDVTVLTNDTNLGYTLASNQGAAASSGEVVVFLNNDTEPQPGWLGALLGCLDAHPECAVVGAKLIYPDGRLQEAGGLVFSDGTAWNFGRLGDAADPRVNEPCEVDYCSGAALAVRRSFLDEVGGGYDPRFAPGYYEDADLCFAARERGWTVRYEPTSVVVHHEGVTAGTDLGRGMKAHQVRNQRVFAQKWAAGLAAQGPPPSASGFAPHVADRAQRLVAASLPPARTPRPGRQRVLVIDPVLPLYDRSAGNLRMFRILRLLRDAGHDVTYLARYTTGQDRYRHELNGMGVRTYGPDPIRLAQLGVDPEGAELLDVGRVLRRGDFDVVWIDFVDTAWQYLPLVRADAPGARVWVDTVDVHHVRAQRRADLAGAAGDPNARQLQILARRTEVRDRWICRQADGVITVTEDDAVAVRRLVAGALVRVVPTVHPVKDDPPALEARRDAVFVGNFQHPPNVDAVRWLCQELWAAVRTHVPDASIDVVGAGLPDDVAAMVSATAGVNHRGWVDDLDGILDGSRVSFSPLRFGAGIKGKVGEALAAGLPVVTTSVGAEGIGLVDGETALVADDVAGLAERVARLLRDDDLWLAVQARGAEHVGDRYSNDTIAGLVDDVLRTDVARRPTLVDRRRTEVTEPPHDDGAGPVSTRGVVVFGMHRSGTSLVTRLLVELGLDPGPRSHLLGATPANPTGHWELRPVQELNDQVLVQLGRYWHCPPTRPAGLAEHAFDGVRDTLRGLLEELVPRFGWVLKDPRLCVMWPMYAPLFGAGPPGGLFAVRHPAEVAVSLHTRDRMDTDHAVALWEFYNCLAAATVATFDHAVVATFDQVMADPDAVAERAGTLMTALGVPPAPSTALGVPPAPSTAGVVDADLNRSSATRDGLRVRKSALALWEQLSAIADGSGALSDVRPPSDRLVATMDERARRVAAHIRALQQGWEEPIARPHRPPE